MHGSGNTTALDFSVIRSLRIARKAIDKAAKAERRRVTQPYREAAARMILEAANGHDNNGVYKMLGKLDRIAYAEQRPYSARALTNLHADLAPILN